MTPFLFLSFLFQIHGTVVDPSGRPVEGAKVSCGAETISTNSAGAFEAGQSCQARVEAPGFAPATSPIDSSKENRIVLTLSPQSDRVIVSATGAPVTLEEAGVSASIFTSKDFDVSRGAFVSNLLRDVPGLNVVQTGQNGGIISTFVRGGSSSSTMVLLDGIPLTEPGGYYDFVHLTSAGLDRMEVVRGPESALFGAEASSGVIQIFTRQGDAESTRPHGSVIYERGSFSTDHWAAALDGGLARKIDYAFTADQFRTTGEFPNDAYRITSGTLNLGYAFTDTTRLRGVFRTFDSYTGDPGQTFYGLYNLDANNHDRDAALSVRLDDARGQRYVQRFLAGYHRYRDTFTDIQTESYNVAALVNVQPNGTYFVRLVPPSTTGSNIVVSPQTLYPFSSTSFTNRTTASYQGTLTQTHGALVFGYEFERQAGVISGSDVDRTNNGLFAQEQYSLTPRIFLTGGLRFQHSSTFGEEVAPRGAVTFRLPTETFLRLSVSRGIREPALYDNFAHESYYIGNPNLKPEKTLAFEAGLNRAWLHGKLRADAAYFRNNFTDLIEFDFSNYPGTSINIDRARSQGMELSGVAQIARNVTVHAAYTFLDTKITKSAAGDYGQPLPRRARNSGSASIEVSPRRWSFIAGVRVVGERQDNDFVFNVTRNPGYQEVFFNGSWRVTPHLTPYLRIGNLLDQTYQEALGYEALTRNATGGLKFTW
jgi:vitamin B12 transporter